MLGKADPDGDGASGALFGTQPPGNAVGKMAEHRTDEFGRDVATTERRLRADREPGATCGVTRRRSSLAASAPTLAPSSPTEQRLQQHRRGEAASWPMRVDAALGESLAGDRARSPTRARPATGRGTLVRWPVAPPPTRRVWPPARRSWQGAWCGPRRPRWAGRPRRARAGGSVADDLRQDRTGGQIRDVEERLVDGDALHERREVAEHCHHVVGQALVLREMSVHEVEVGAESFGPPSRHSALHPELFRFVRRGQHHAASDSDRTSTQLRVQQLLDRCVERIEVGVKDGGTGWHLPHSSRTRVR